jgi:PAS domain S-box-containing protein
LSQSEDIVLLVDDNPTNLEVLYQTLDGEGYRLLAARGGEAALAIIHEANPTLILLDIMMPGMDGFQVCERLKSNPATADIAVIFLSALGDTDTKVKGFELGAVDYISKPFQAAEIVARVATHIKIQRLERQLSHRNIELEQEITRILATMQEGVFGVDLNAYITYANRAAAHLSGWEQNELVGQAALTGHLRAADGSPRSTQSAPYDQVFREGRRIELECETIWRKDQTYFRASLNCTPVLENGQVRGAVIVFRDITQRLQAELELQETRMELQKQRQRLAHIERLSTMGEMAAGFAHEVNQPLTAIANYASVSRRLAEKESIDREKLSSALEKMQTQALRASEVIQRLRSFVRKPKTGRDMRDPNAVVEEVIQLAEVDSRYNKVPIHFTPGVEGMSVCIDDVQIQQVLLNLVRNAMEAMGTTVYRDEGVKISTGSPVPQVVRFSVVDHGEGLADDAEDRLFHPFYTTKDDGMGIGLSVCASIMQDHGGEIGFRRNENGGATFYIDLAAKPCPDSGNSPAGP